MRVLMERICICWTSLTSKTKRFWELIPLFGPDVNRPGYLPSRHAHRSGLSSPRTRKHPSLKGLDQAQSKAVQCGKPNYGPFQDGFYMFLPPISGKMGVLYIFSADLTPQSLYCQDAPTSPWFNQQIFSPSERRLYTASGSAGLGCWARWKYGHQQWDLKIPDFMTQKVAKNQVPRTKGITD